MGYLELLSCNHQHTNRSHLLAIGSAVNGVCVCGGGRFQIVISWHHNEWCLCGQGRLPAGVSVVVRFGYIKFSLPLIPLMLCRNTNEFMGYVVRLRFPIHGTRFIVDLRILGVLCWMMVRCSMFVQDECFIGIASLLLRNGHIVAAFPWRDLLRLPVIVVGRFTLV